MSPQPSDENGTRNGSRPVSVYDNYADNGNARNDRGVRETRLDGTPSLAHCLVTTVPQNIAAETLAKKHTPNRNSLRHSRMIAMNKTGRVPHKYLPAIIRYHKLAKALLGLVTLLGLAICFLALWLLLWAPNIRYRDNPHWSGMPVLLSGMVGLILVFCFRKEHPGTRNYFVYAIRVFSIALSALAAVAAFTASAFAIIHLVSLYTMSCVPSAQLDKTCVCQITSSLNDTTTSVHSYHYIDLSCVEVDNILTILIIFSAATNLIAGVLEVWYIYLHWASRYKYTYSKVRTEDNTPTVLTNLR